MSDRAPLVSVVTPLFNTEKYLAKCIESVLSQTYTNFEYVIVDNCSTDGSREIAQRYASQDRRIRIVNNSEHLSMLRNWNHSLRQVSQDSKYCKIVHADDWLFPRCIEKMVEVAESNPHVGIVSSYRLEETKVTCDGLPYPSTVIPGKEICRSSLLGGPYVFGSPTTLLVRCNTVRKADPFYSEENIHADNEACYGILRDSDFGFVHEVLSFTRRHNETQTTLSRRLNTFIVGELLILDKYGLVYLTDEEYAHMLKRRMRTYYLFLGKSLFKSRNGEFWRYHRTALQKLGDGLSYRRLAKAAFIALFNHILERMRIQ